MEVLNFDVAVRKGGGKHLANGQAGLRATLKLSVSARVGILIIQHATERLPVTSVPGLEILACNIGRAGHGAAPFLTYGAYQRGDYNASGNRGHRSRELTSPGSRWW